MAAGLGFKDFTTGEVLTAADVDGYLMQGIWVFATTAARDAAVTAPAEGNFAFTKDTNSLWYYDGATWVASGATGDIEGVTAGVGISGGGTSGTVTITNSMATAIDAKGDLVVGTAADTFSRLAVGATAGQVLTVDSAEATGMKWATPGGAGANWSLLNSGGTALTGAGTITVSGISGKDKIMILIDSASSASGDSDIGVRFNTDSGSNYYRYGYRLKTPTSYAASILVPVNGVSTSIVIGGMSDVATSEVSGYLMLTGCNSAGVKVFESGGSGLQSGSENQELYHTGGYYNSATTISSISVRSSTGDFDGSGRVYVYTSA